MGFSDELTRALELTENRFVIGARGLEAPGGDKLSLIKNRVYAMGASSSPDLIFVTGVSETAITYRSWPFHEGKEHRVQTWVARDQIARGTRTYLQAYGRHMDKKFKRSLEDLMDGGKGMAEKLSDYNKIFVAVKSKMGGDPWYTAEKYGNVGGLSDPPSAIVEIETIAKVLPKIKQDKDLEIIKVSNKMLHTKDFQ